VPAVTGTRGDDFVRQRIFDPLGMSATGTRVAALDTAGDVATPHERIEGRERAVRWR
jgi:CubicO group peptidase (beta-lactamase class C family)